MACIGWNYIIFSFWVQWLDNPINQDELGSEQTTHLVSWKWERASSAERVSSIETISPHSSAQQGQIQEAHQKGSPQFSHYSLQNPPEKLAHLLRTDPTRCSIPSRFLPLRRRRYQFPAAQITFQGKWVAEFLPDTLKIRWWELVRRLWEWIWGRVMRSMWEWGLQLPW